MALIKIFTKRRFGRFGKGRGVVQILVEIYFFLFLTGLFIGSFLNACIYRIPRQISLLHPRRSFCPHCGQTITWRQNIPLVSYVLLRGKCHHCRENISLRYPIVEILTGGITVATAWQIGFGARLLFSLPLFYGLIVISFIDWQYKIIPNKILLVLFGIAILVNSLTGAVEWLFFLGGGMFSGALLLVIARLGFWLFKKESVGMGDIKLAGLIGCVVGWQAFLLSLFVASFSALATLILLKIFSVTVNFQKIPFAPFLSLGAFATLLWGAMFLRWYIGLF